MPSYSKLPTILLTLWALAGIGGCSARYTAHHTDHGTHVPDEGFHYFLPKPYLLVTNVTTLPTPGNGGAASPPPTGDGTKPTDSGGGKPTSKAEKPIDGANKDGGGGGSTDGTDGKNPPGSIITLQLLWLPDMDEEYVIQVSGNTIGTFEGSIQLQNGWMLTGLNQKSDPKIAETLTAATGFLSSIFTAAGLSAPAGTKGITKTIETGEQILPFVYLFEVDLPRTGHPGALHQVNSDVLNELLKRVICDRGCKGN